MKRKYHVSANQEMSLPKELQLSMSNECFVFGARSEREERDAKEKDGHLGLMPDVEGKCVPQIGMETPGHGCRCWGRSIVGQAKERACDLALSILTPPRLAE